MKSTIISNTIKSVFVLMMLMTHSIQAQEKTNPYFGGSDDVAFAKALWVSMKKNNLVGKDAINVFPFNGNQPHGAIQQVLDSDIRVNGKTSRVIVKRNHGGKNINVKTVYSDPTTHLKAVTVMYKRESGYDSDNLDWFWAKYTPTGDIAKNPKGALLAGRIGKNGSKGCIACHKVLGGTDLETLTEK